MNRIKNDFIKELTETGLSATDAKKIMDLFIENITKNLEIRKEIHLTNFGKFKVVKKKKKAFINPKTGKMSEIKGENKVRFTPSKNLTKYLNYGK